jgi:hypothetical protein
MERGAQAFDLFDDLEKELGLGKTRAKGTHELKPD